MKRLCTIAVVAITALAAKAQTAPGSDAAQTPEWETATEVYANMFVGHEDIKDLKLTNVSKIRHEAFYKLTSLETIYITNENNKPIFGWSDNRLFPESDELDETNQSDVAERYNANLTSVILCVPFVSDWGQLTPGSFPYFTYLNCTPKYIAYKSPKLETVVLPEEIYAIREYSFCGSEVLRSIRIPAKVAEIHKGAFADCPAIETVVCESGMPPIIRDETFSPNRGKITLYVPKGFGEVYRSDPQWGRFGTIIEDENITCPYTPDMLPTHNTKAFDYYWALEKFYMYFNYAVWDEDEAIAAVTPVHTYIEGFEEDGYPLYKNVCIDYHFPTQYNSLMEAKSTVTIDGKEYKVSVIGNHAFSNKNIRVIEIPDNIEHIGYGAYYGHKLLETVKVHRAEPPTMGDDRVFGDKSALTLEVPVGAAAAYRAAEVWRDFGNIVENAELGNSSVVSIDADLPTGPDTYYSIDGRQLTGRPAPGTLHIVRHADGSATLRR